MPRLLKGETNRRLIVSQRALALAFSMLATPKPVGYEADETDGAIEVGLIGVAADLAISACLYEILGVSGIVRKDTGFFLTAAEALDTFRRTLGSTIPRLAALTTGVTDPPGHLKKLEVIWPEFGGSRFGCSRAEAICAGAWSSLPPGTAEFQSSATGSRRILA